MKKIDWKRLALAAICATALFVMIMALVYLAPTASGIIGVVIIVTCLMLTFYELFDAKEVDDDKYNNQK